MTEEHHHHHHSAQITSLNTAFVLGIILNSLFVVVEFTIGFINSSVGLISDAGHNLTDVASLILAMLAFKIAKINSSSKYTYGYKKSTILVSLFNAVILLVAICFIIYESIQKFIHPIAVSGNIISITAIVGVVVNGLTAYLFMKDKEKDLNIKGAYLHMAADCLVSVGVVVSGFIISFTGWYFIDGIIGLLVSVIIIYSTFNLLNDSIRLSMDGVPKNVDYDNVVKEMKTIEGIIDIHHIHIWAISTTENALTAHIFINDINNMESIKTEIKHHLIHNNIQHSTLEFEIEGCCCKEKDLICKD
ncbi:MAG: cation diffusion facilitator family transporter [Bacteroidales bacterium]|jgi:cobalt-zinc-cadmium efflux system protein|nr:cation diffusion facilitator family transporter [Bacteroidales bacterium]